MKRNTLFLRTLVLAGCVLVAVLFIALAAGCSNDPIIVPDLTSDNVVMMELKDRIAEPGAYSPSYGWLYWYAPLASILMMWGYRTLIRKPIDCIEEEPNSIKVQEKIDDKPST